MLVAVHHEAIFAASPSTHRFQASASKPQPQGGAAAPRGLHGWIRPFPAHARFRFNSFSSCQFFQLLGLGLFGCRLFSGRIAIA
jgi:hypothetical protein